MKREYIHVQFATLELEKFRWYWVVSVDSDEYRFPVLLSGYITAFRTVSNDFRVLSPMLMIFHKLTGPHNDEVERNSIREEDREGWNDGDPESWKRL